MTQVALRAVDRPTVAEFIARPSSGSSITRQQHLICNNSLWQLSGQFRVLLTPPVTMVSLQHGHKQQQHLAMTSEPGGGTVGAAWSWAVLVRII